MEKEEKQKLEQKVYYVPNDDKPYIAKYMDKAPKDAIELPEEFWDVPIEALSVERVGEDFIFSVDLDKQKQIEDKLNDEKNTFERNSNAMGVVVSSQLIFEQALETYLSTLKDISPEFKAILDERLAARLALIGGANARKLV